MRIVHAIAAALGLTMLSAPAHAEFRQVSERATFLDIVQGRELSRLGVSLRVTPDGRITGSALGFDVTGSWEWRNGYFCRTIDYGSGRLPNNCQVVLVNGGGTVRFIADQGQGDSADLSLR
ncbi:dihydrodipicolinate reductase [Tranquillimonas rosea]|uniref:dihydrodipicolinate reductase n=1 Tax=Tranquillimonas rosea TaxID=641238 RepID=UPI003BAD6723